jgi:hypothetical protein
MNKYNPDYLWSPEEFDQDFPGVLDKLKEEIMAISDDVDMAIINIPKKYAINRSRIMFETSSIEELANINLRALKKHLIALERKENLKDE